MYLSLCADMCPPFPWSGSSHPFSIPLCRSHSNTQEQCQAALTIRITVKDKRTGKMGVLWNTGDGLPLHVDSFYDESGKTPKGFIDMRRLSCE